MEYIIFKRFKDKAICGNVNLPAMTICQETNGILHCQVYNEAKGQSEHKILCRTTSENAHMHFARNDDGEGMQRGHLTEAIIKTLAKNDKRHQTRWNKVWKDKVCQAYKRPEHQDHWVWNHAFFNADIETLTYIAKLVGAKI